MKTVRTTNEVGVNQVIFYSIFLGWNLYKGGEHYFFGTIRH